VTHPDTPGAESCLHYSKDRSRVTVYGDGAWEHEDGKGRRVKGSGKEALASHLAACGKASKAVRDEIADMLLEGVAAVKGVPMASNLKKSMYHINALSSLLQQIRELQAAVVYEGQAEGDDRDTLIALHLGDWLEDGAKILGEVFTDETSELLDASNRLSGNASEPEPAPGPIATAAAGLNSF
jgi:hypothetical protein